MSRPWMEMDVLRSTDVTAKYWLPSLTHGFDWTKRWPARAVPSPAGLSDSRLTCWKRNAMFRTLVSFTEACSLSMSPAAPSALRKFSSRLIPTLKDTESDQVPDRSARSSSTNGSARTRGGSMISLSKLGAVMRPPSLMYTLPHRTRRPGMESRLT